MNTELKDALVGGRVEPGQAALDLEAKLQPLLQGVLTRLWRSGDTPLQFGIDSGEIMCAAWADVSAGIPEDDLRQWPAWSEVKTILDRSLTRSLQDERSTHDADDARPIRLEHIRETGDGNGVTETPTHPIHPLAGWLENLNKVMREVHPRAIEIAGLRVQGFQDRDIAERLEMGLRLVKHIVRDACTRRDADSEKE